MAFPYGQTLKSEVDTIQSWRRRRELADQQFRFHTEPERAAAATLSLRSAFPWMSPNLAAQLGAYGVDPATPEIFDVAAVAAQRRMRRGWESPGRRRSAAEVRNVVKNFDFDLAGGIPKTLDAVPVEDRMVTAEDRLADNLARDQGTTFGSPTVADVVLRDNPAGLDPGSRYTDPDMLPIPGPTQPADLGVGNVRVGGTGPGLVEAARMSDRQRLAFEYARAPGDSVFENAAPGLADTEAQRQQIMGMAAQYRQFLPTIDDTVRHIRRGGLMFEGVPLPNADVSVDDLRPIYTGPMRDEIRGRLTRKRTQLEEQYGDDLDAMTPAMRNVYNGIVTALDEVIEPSLETVGPDLEVQAAGIDADLNVSDVWNVPYDAARNTIRGATAVMDSLWQYSQARFREFVDDPSVDNYGRSLAMGNPSTMGAVFSQDVGAAVSQGEGAFAETDLGIILERLANGQSVDTGAGFFVTPDSEVGQERRRREVEHGLIGGHVITMGRWTADQIPGVEPDTMPFDIVSGVVDLGLVLLEPGGAAVDAVTRAPATRRALAHAGGFTATRSVHPEMFDQWLRSDDGIRVINTFADLPDEQATYRLWQESSRAGGASAMPRWAFYQLAAQETPEAVASTLRNLTGMGYMTPGVPSRGVVAPAPAFRRRLSSSRMSQEVPETGARALDMYDADGFVSGLEASLRNARVDEDAVAGIVGRAYAAFEPPTRVRMAQLERELAEAGPDRAAEIMGEMDRLRAGLFVARPTPRRNQLFQVWEEAQQAKIDRLVEAGHADQAGSLASLMEVGRRVNRRMANDHLNEGLFWLEMATDNLAKNRGLWAVAGGQQVVDASAPSFAHLAAEHITRYLPLEDDYRQLARLTRSLPVTVMNSWLSSPSSGQLFAPWRMVEEVFVNRIWKPSRLLRPAWPIRVVGEEQFRIAATGLDSAVTHPLSYMALVLGYRRDGRMARLLDAVPGERSQAFSADATGTPWEAVTEHSDALNRASRTWLLPSTGGYGGRFEPMAFLNSEGPAGIPTAGYYGAWADQMARAHSDNIARRVAQIQLGIDSQYDSIDDLIAAGGDAVTSADDLRLGINNEIARTRADLMDSHPELGKRGDATWATRSQAGDNTILNWDDYIESIQVRLAEITAGDDELLHAVARGRFTDGLTLDTPNTTRINRRAVKRLEADFAGRGPEAISGDVAHHERALGRVSSRVPDDMYDRALERMYAMLGAVPTDRLSRSPAFRQFYWRRMQELLPYMDEQAKATVLRNAEELADIPKDPFHIRLSAYIGDADSVTAPSQASLRRAAGAGTGDIDLELADELAKHAALDNTRWLLYDVHKRGQFMDAMRIVFPFGEAWKEVITRWMQLTAQRPGTVIQRATQIVGATGSPQPFEDQVEDPSQHGWIFENATGETVFTYPAAEWFTSAATGVPVQLTGSFNGLTLMSSVLPGVGPVIQIPASFSRRLRNDPALEGIRNALFPYGLGENPTDSWATGGMATADAFLSPAAQRFLVGAVTTATGHGPGDDRMFMNSVFDVMRYNVSTGEYSTSSSREINRLVNESTRDAGILYMIRGLAGMVLPSAPIPEFQVEGNEGLLMLRALTERYRELQQEDFSTASQRFLDQYGQNLSLVMQSKTVPTTTMLPVTGEADRWVQSNPGIQTDFPLTFGLWAPAPDDPDNTDFDFEAYTRYANDRSLKVLGRELDVRDLVYLANDRVASLEYRSYEQELLDNPAAVTEDGNLTTEAQRFLSTEVTPWLREQYPGFGSDGLERGPSTDDLRDAIGGPGETDTELRRAVRDDRIAGPIRDAIAGYLDYHDEFMEAVDSDPDQYEGASTFYESSATRPMRDFMRNEVFPYLRSELPQEYRAQWDQIVDRLLDRVMLAPWLEEATETPVGVGVAA